MKTAIIPALVLAVCGTALSAQNVQDIQANAKLAHITLKTNPALQTRKQSAFYLRKETLKKPLVDSEPAFERRSSSMNPGTVTVKAFPNPFAGDVTVSINDATGSEILYEANVFDLQGRKVYSQNIVSKKEKMNLSSMANGMYILTVTKNGVVFLQEELAKE